MNQLNETFKALGIGEIYGVTPDIDRHKRDEEIGIKTNEIEKQKNNKVKRYLVAWIEEDKAMNENRERKWIVLDDSKSKYSGKDKDLVAYHLVLVDHGLHEGNAATALRILQKQ